MHSRSAKEGNGLSFLIFAQDIERCPANLRYALWNIKQEIILSFLFLFFSPLTKRQFK